MVDYSTKFDSTLSHNSLRSFSPENFTATTVYGPLALPWFADYMHLVFWFFFLTILILSIWLVQTFFLLIRCGESRQPIRETRGFSRAQTGDSLTAVIPMCWSITMLMHASTHSSNFDENTDSTSLSLTIIAYQWGWNYYFPSDSKPPFVSDHKTTIFENLKLRSAATVNNNPAVFNKYSEPVFKNPSRNSLRHYISTTCTRKLRFTTNPKHFNCVSVPSNFTRKTLTDNNLSGFTKVIPWVNKVWKIYVVQDTRIAEVSWGTAGLVPITINDKARAKTTRYWCWVKEVLTFYPKIKTWIFDPFEDLCLAVGFKKAWLMSQSPNYGWPSHAFRGRLTNPTRVLEASNPTTNYIMGDGVVSRRTISALSRKHSNRYNQLAKQLTNSLAGRQVETNTASAMDRLNCSGFTKTNTYFELVPRRAKSTISIVLPKALEDVDTDYFSSKFLFELSSTRKACTVNQDLLMVGGLVHRMRITSGVVLPSDVPIHLTCGSKDVVHSWAVPGLSIKIDCVPGLNCHRRVLIRWRGLFWGQCMEVCGRYHHWMPLLLRVNHVDLFYLWLRAMSE